MSKNKNIDDIPYDPLFDEEDEAPTTPAAKPISMAERKAAILAKKELARKEAAVEKAEKVSKPKQKVKFKEPASPVDTDAGDDDDEAPEVEVPKTKKTKTAKVAKVVKLKTVNNVKARAKAAPAPTRAVTPTPAAKRTKPTTAPVKVIRSKDIEEPTAPTPRKSRKPAPVRRHQGSTTREKKYRCLITGKKCSGKWFARGQWAAWNGIMIKIERGELDKKVLKQYDKNAVKLMGPWKATKAGGEKPTHDFTALRQGE